MAQVWRDWGGVVAASVATVPLAALIMALLAAWRRRCGTPRRTAWRRSFAEVGIVAGTLPWVWMILTPQPARREVHLVPLSDLANQLSGEPVKAALEIGGNLLVFAALGFCAPMRFAALATVPRLFLLGAAASMVVEALQYQLDIGRVTSVDDVLVNATGAALAGLASRRWWVTRSPRAADATPATTPR